MRPRPGPRPWPHFAPFLALALLAVAPVAASNAQDDCGTGVDAPQTPGVGLSMPMPIDCLGALEPREGDDWDIFAVDLTEGPVYATLWFDPMPGAEHDLCIVTGAWTDAACSEDWGPEEISLWWPAGPAFVVPIASGEGASYHLHVHQQDDCGVGYDALWDVAAPLATPYVHCEALLDTFTGDSEDAFLVPPPAVPDVVIVRMEPMPARAQICVDDEIHQLGLRSRCTDSTFSRIVVARDPLRPLRVTVEGFGVDPIGYTLIVENAAEHPPQIPPLL